MKRSAIWIGLLLLCGALGWLTWHNAHAEPSYQGRSLSAWLAEYCGVDEGGLPRGIVDEAMRQMGTNAVPFLLDEFDAEEPLWRSSLQNLQTRFKVELVRLKNFDSVDHRIDAEIAFIALRPRAREVVPLLLQMYENPGGDSVAVALNRRCRILKALACLGPAAREAVPLLLREAESTNDLIRLLAYDAMGECHAQPDLIVPALIRGLRNPDFHVRQSVLASIGNFGAAAKPAIPELEAILAEATQQDEAKGSEDTRMLQACAADALREIKAAGVAAP